MRITKRRPVSVGEMLTTEFLQPLKLEISELADAMGVHRNSVSRLIHDKGQLTAPSHQLAIALGTRPSSGSTSSMQSNCGMCATAATPRKTTTPGR